MRAQIVDFLLGAAEEQRVAPLEAHDDPMLPGGVGQALVDEVLRGRVPAAALADRDLLGARREREDRLRDERVMEHDLGLG